MQTQLETDTVRVVVVDDYAEVRFLLSLQLETGSDLRVVGEAGTASEALEVVADTRPDVVLLDHRLGRRESLSIIGELCRLGAVVIVVTGLVTEELEQQARLAGAFAVLDKQDVARLLPGIL